MKSILNEKYKIKITKDSIIPTNPKEYLIHSNNGSCYKIYIIRDRKDFLYVGMAKQKIRARFSGGFRAYSQKKETGKSEYGGYSGYKWIEKYQVSGREIELIVFPFIDKVLRSDEKFIEAIEAEIVFLIRTQTNKWPLSQHEIHFHNDAKARKIAGEIFNSI
jgi:hypothetical protein